MNGSFENKAQLKGKDLSFYDFKKSVISEQKKFNFDLEKDKWIVGDHLKNKVSIDGVLKPFFGDTVVFSLNNSIIEKISKVQSYFENNYKIFADRLNPKSFHITLHDLSNGPISSEISASIEKNKAKCALIFKRLEQEDLSINVESSCLYQANNIALLLGFMPKCEIDYYRLVNLYNLFEDVVYLDYPPRFHVTLNYFLPEKVDCKTAIQLKNEIDNFDFRKIEFKICLKDMVYQHFLSMNCYQDTIKMSF